MHAGGLPKALVFDTMYKSEPISPQIWFSSIVPNNH